MRFIGIFSLCAAVANAAWLVSAVYQTAAVSWLEDKQIQKTHAATASAQDAYAFSTKVMPWLGGMAYDTDARLLPDLIPSNDTEGLWEQTLQRHPANAHIWSAWTSVLVKQAILDARLENALDNILNLEPHSLPISRFQTLLAAKHWPRSKAGHRSLWKASYDVAMHQPFKLTRAAAQKRLELGLCHLSDLRLKKWCGDIAWIRPLCDSRHGLTPKKKKKRDKFCHSRGFLVPKR